MCVDDGNMIAYSSEIRLVSSTPEGWVDAGRSRMINMSSSLALEIEYFRDLSKTSDSMASVAGGASTLGASALQSVVNGIRVRLRERSSVGGSAAAAAAASAASAHWDVECLLDLDKSLRLLGGQGYVSVVGAGLFHKESGTQGSIAADDDTKGSPSKRFSTSQQETSLFYFNLSSFGFACRGSSLSTYPVASALTSSRFPETFTWLDARLAQYRSWMSLKLVFKFPSVFGIVVDSDAVYSYSRVFSSLIKVSVFIFNVACSVCHKQSFLPLGSINISCV